MDALCDCNKMVDPCYAISPYNFGRQNKKRPERILLVKRYRLHNAVKISKNLECIVRDTLDLDSQPILIFVVIVYKYLGQTTF